MEREANAVQMPPPPPPAARARIESASSVHRSVHTRVQTVQEDFKSPARCTDHLA